MSMITEYAPAKVNLTLEVLGKRPDGYHEIASLVAFADFGDVIALDTSKPAEVRVSGPFGEGIAGPNLIEVTLRKLTDANPELALGAVHLEKRLPVAAGIGGGSADAAAVLRAVRRANPALANSVDWYALAKSLGADVPVCLFNLPAWVTGVGETLEEAGDLPALDAVLVNPMVPMPPDKTAQVFRGLNARPLDSRQMAERASRPGLFASSDALIGYMASRGNSLADAACGVAPVIEVVKSALLAAPRCQYAGVSGAGPTCFGIYEDPVAAAHGIISAHPDWWVKPVRLGAPVCSSAG